MSRHVFLCRACSFDNPFGSSYHVRTLTKKNLVRSLHCQEQEHLLNSSFYPSPFKRQVLKKLFLKLFFYPSQVSGKLKTSFYYLIIQPYWCPILFNISNFAFTISLAWHQHVYLFSATPLFIVCIVLLLHILVTISWRTFTWAMTLFSNGTG